MAQKKWVSVKKSKLHRRPAHDVKGYHMKRTKDPLRIKKHKRRPRRTQAQIAAAKARQQAAQKKKKSKP